MWNRANLKLRAKAVLRVSYWKALLAALVLGIVSGTSNAEYRVSSQDMDRAADHIADSILNNDQLVQLLRVFMPILITASVLALVVGFALRLLVFHPLDVGGRRYFLESAQYRFQLGNLGFGFMGGGYWNVVVTMLYRAVLIFLWTLLLIIPGIVKSYAYRMVPYILADNPRIPYNRAVQMSNEMTKGHKMEMFVLDLSFIGWILLGALACGVGIIFVQPYVQATEAELYLTLREIALQKGIAHPDEFRGY